jgi:hypothetical protein
METVLNSTNSNVFLRGPSLPAGRYLIQYNATFMWSTVPSRGKLHCFGFPVNGGFVQHDQDFLDTEPSDAKNVAMTSMSFQNVGDNPFTRNVGSLTCEIENPSTAVGGFNTVMTIAVSPAQ